MFAVGRDAFFRLYPVWNWQLPRTDKSPAVPHPPGSRTLSHRFSAILHNSLGTHGLPARISPRLRAILRSKKGARYVRRPV